ncbi:MAG: hypothetical protein MZV70_19385 [Desulfobacterales bacterium]|nr:hypothetical protein [Desulfobacterales bacterium]
MRSSARARLLQGTDQHIVIKFDEAGEKKFVLEIAREHVKKIDRQPPAEKKKARAKREGGSRRRSRRVTARGFPRPVI